MHHIEIAQHPFDPWQYLSNFQQTILPVNAFGSFGATAVFVGTMRDFNEGDDVTSMTLEHYPGMTDKQLQHIVEEAEAQWPLLHSLLLHRVGHIQPGENIVLVAVWSAHRAAAFEASRFIMEALKKKAPFWKKEVLLDGESRWVSKNTPG